MPIRLTQEDTWVERGDQAAPLPVGIPELTG